MVPYSTFTLAFGGSIVPKLNLYESFHVDPVFETLLMRGYLQDHGSHLSSVL